MVVARAGVAKGTCYVHFTDRAAFVDAMHARFHERVEAAVAEVVAGLPPGVAARAAAVPRDLNTLSVLSARARQSLRGRLHHPDGVP
jgi:AcrR family transcriptional regulator